MSGDLDDLDGDLSDVCTGVECTTPMKRLRLERHREAEEKKLWEAGRRLHRQFRYLDTEVSTEQQTEATVKGGRQL